VPKVTSLANGAPISAANRNCISLAACWDEKLKKIRLTELLGLDATRPEQETQRTLLVNVTASKASGEIRQFLSR
jgi:hypothetical protein